MRWKNRGSQAMKSSQGFESFPKYNPRTWPPQNAKRRLKDSAKYDAHELKELMTFPRRDITGAIVTYMELVVQLSF